MAKGLFPPRRELLINFDWTDIASGAGYIEYDAYATIDSTGITYSLIETNEASNLKSYNVVSGGGYNLNSGSASNNAFTKILDNDWDTSEFNTPRTIRGRAFVKFGAYMDEIADTGDNPEYYFKARIRKWNGTSETEIAVAQTTTLQTGDNEVDDYQLSLEIPSTLVKKGEQIRLTLEGWAKDDQSDAHTLYLAGQPDDSAVTNLSAGNSRIVLLMPFRLET